MIDSLYQWFLAPYEGYTPLFIFLEVMSAFFGILSVWYIKRNSIWGYPTGIISTATYVYLLYCWGIYGDAAVNVYYTLMSIYGWWVWATVRTDDSQDEMPITRLDRKGLYFTLSFTIGNFLLFYLVLSRYTDSTVPLVDSVTTALAFGAMWLQARKKLEHWSLWIACDVLSIGLYIYKGYGVTAVQYVIFLVLAVMAHFDWVKMYKASLSKSTARN